MPSSKDRPYLALYTCSGSLKMLGGEDKWISPEPSASGRRYHAKETMQNVNGIVKNVWVFEDRQISLQPTSAILVRIIIGKALSWAAHDGKALGNCHTDWTYVKDTAMWYVAKKAADHRFDGEGEFDQSKVPIWDALEEKELIA
ncbi:hypothetical protein DL98DRAFT_564342 [Cadophora sp. DSE1049]|nr:hypothetical protein DL98DRAFT_564342 [Cadophora sp. DSE1049]